MSTAENAVNALERLLREATPVAKEAWASLVSFYRFEGIVYSLLWAGVLVVVGLYGRWAVKWFKDDERDNDYDMGVGVGIALGVLVAVLAFNLLGESVACAFNPQGFAIHSVVSTASR